MSVATTAPAKRIPSIDILRGIVMVVMALDHTRDFFSNFPYEPTDLQHAGAAMFFTRWITHFCAPVFVFLSGTSAFLSVGRGKTKRQASWGLLTRGLWLIVLEVTIVKTGWSFDFDYNRVFLQVIWAIGCSMAVLSLLIFLPRWLILTLALTMIFGHNAFDGLHPSGGMGVLWQFLHVQSPVRWGNGNVIMILYPLIPWIGVMAVGFCFGALFSMDEKKRRTILWLIGAGCIALFIVLRLINRYGDPSPWVAQGTWWRTVLSFLNCSKYPPSLLYLLMTLGPAVCLLALMSGSSMRGGFGGRMMNVFTVYGRVPLFYYVLHIYLIHALAVATAYVHPGSMAGVMFPHPGFPLPVVYAYWLAVVALLYIPCRWFMQVKMSRRHWWLSYL